jgi:hypothetical protein
MDTLGWVLAVLLALSIALQLCLPILGWWNRRLDARQLKLKRAHLLEDAADRQLHTSAQHMAKLGSIKGVPDADH